MAESLRKKQSRFVWMVADLILHAKSLGYELTFGDAYRDDRCAYGQPFSLHKQKLAIDLNLFVDGKYIKSSEHPAYMHLGAYWESLGGSWGGRFSDANHFSIEHQGFR